MKATKQAKAKGAEALISPFTGIAIYEKRKAASNELDIYVFEGEWRAYAKEMNEAMKDPEREF